MSPEQASGQTRWTNAVATSGPSASSSGKYSPAADSSMPKPSPTPSPTSSAPKSTSPNSPTPPHQPSTASSAAASNDVPKNRLQAIGEARIAINEQLADPAGASVLMDAPALPAMPPPPRKLPWIAAGVLTVALLASLAGWWQTTRPVEQPLRRFNEDLGAGMALNTRFGAAAILSPDGASMVFLAQGSDGASRLHIRRFSQSDPVELSGTEGARGPFFSPDGQWIGFFADGKLKKIAVHGGAAVTLCDAPGDRGGSWGEDGRIVFGQRRAGLLGVAAAGGMPVPLTELDEEVNEGSHRWPQVLPGDGAVLFTTRTGGEWSEANMEVYSLETGERKTLHRGGTYGRYLPSGHLVYVHEGTLFAAPMDLARLELTGPPAPALERVLASRANGGAQFDFSKDGTFVFIGGEPGGVSRSVHWLDATGKTEPLPAEPGRYLTPQLSPDGERLAVAAHISDNWDIWVYELERGAMSRLTFDPAPELFPVWTPDGGYIAFRSNSGDERSGIQLVRADGAGQLQTLTQSAKPHTPSSFSSDGRWLAFTEQNPEMGLDIRTVPLEGGDANPPRAGEPETFLSTPSDESSPKFSLDGHWLAYSSNESGVSEIYVRPFPGPGGKWQVSNGGGDFPLWSPKGREIFYETPGRQIMVAGYSATGDSFQAAKPRLWSETRLLFTGPYQTYDVSPDGNRFALLLGVDETGSQNVSHHVTILQNFFDELDRLAPANGGPTQ